MYRENLAPGENYHIFNRGNHKQNIFLNDRDRSRFLFLLLVFQWEESRPHLSREFNEFAKLSPTYLDGQHPMLAKVEVGGKKLVELDAFCLMPNHYHLMIKQVSENGISKYLQKIQNSYTKYTNIKYEKSGHLFKGAYSAVHVENNNQLLYLSAYIHRNPREFSIWKDKEHEYPWSSYKDYLLSSRWGNFLKRDLVLKQFDTPKEYREFVESSGAKETERFLDEGLMID